MDPLRNTRKAKNFREHPEKRNPDTKEGNAYSRPHSPPMPGILTPIDRRVCGIFGFARHNNVKLFEFK